ncbi:hypothetical protein ACQPZF_23905 [Actinosynnema sp. CS-041913]|uniref:hypothetical protein n=1 Tax=Actinosynnema sp. CS-041913 TaxID=3239917 RepID=UPI003D944242
MTVSGTRTRRGRIPVLASDARTRRIPHRIHLSDPEPTPEQADDTKGPARALKLVGSAIANATLLTALVFHFGFLYTQVFFSHFRVHYTMLGQTTEEILARGADGMFIPLAVISAATLLVTCAVRYLRVRLKASTWLAVLRVCTPIAAVVGIVLVGTAVLVAVDPEPFREYPGLPGMGFSVGILSLVFAWRRVVSASDAADRAAGAVVAEWVITFVLVSIGLFWAVSDYSTAVGVRRAFEVEARVPAMPDALLFSTRSLNLSARDVREVECTRPDSAYRYRYDGLKLLLQSGNQYVLLPVAWTSADGTAIVLPRNDQLRLEFTPAATAPGDTC